MQLNLGRHRRTRTDDGFTLIELVMTVAIMGIISATLLGVMFQYLKTTTDTSARLNESTDQQFISTYWQNDVSSLGRQTLNSSSSLTAAQSVFVDSAGPAGCGASLGTVVVAFAWNEFKVNAVDPANAWDTTPHEVAYILPSGKVGLLQRLRCRNGVPNSNGRQTVARNLAAITPTVRCGDGSDPSTDSKAKCTSLPRPDRVSMTFTVKDPRHSKSQGYTTTVTADRRQG